MDAIKALADAIRAERKAAEEVATGTGKASAEDIKKAVTAGQDEPEKKPDKDPDKDDKDDKEPDKDPDKKEE